MDKHQWSVTLSDDKQGFRKQVDVEAHGASQAVTFAGDHLVRQGYDRLRFEVVSLSRGKKLNA